MVKKFFGILFIILVLVVLKKKKNTLIFVYFNPYTNTSSFPYIGKTIKFLDKAFNYAQTSAAKDGLKFNYLFWNAYGSGFIKDNNIPNDLDFAIGIDLGSYKYDGKNTDKIAFSVIDKINAFQTSFNFYINTQNNTETFITRTPFELQYIISKQYDNDVKNFSENLDKALSGENYINYTQKQIENLNLDIPYIMKSHEILLENREPITLYSNLVKYNAFMPQYKREISIIPEFFINIVYKGKNNFIEIVPESFVGERLQLSRRFFASTVFIHNSSIPFLKNLPYINNDTEYLFYRMLSFRRHLQEINNILVTEDRPVKLLKRLKQTADMISPVLSPKMYNEISEFTAQNLANKDIQLLNEYSNICGNILNIMEHTKLYSKMKQSGDIDYMYNILYLTLDTLDQRGNVDKRAIQIMRDFANTKADNISREELLEKYEKVNNEIVKAIYSQMSDKSKIERYIAIFNQIYIDAGYHKVSLYWLDKNTIGILKDDFTKNIKDFNDFAKQNNLVTINYKLIKPEQAPSLTLRYDILARYNSTEDENKEYERFKEKLLKDRANFTIKEKFVILK